MNDNESFAKKAVERYLRGTVEVIGFKDGEIRSTIEVRHNGKVTSYVVDHATGFVSLK